MTRSNWSYTGEKYNQPLLYTTKHNILCRIFVLLVQFVLTGYNKLLINLVLRIRSSFFCLEPESIPGLGRPEPPKNWWLRNTK